MNQFASIWELLLAARDVDWSVGRAFSADIAGARLDLEPGGQWRAEGAVTQEGRDLLDALLPVLVRPDGIAVGQLGQSLDGRIATDSGDSWYINGHVGRVHLHRLRALVDAVLVGAGTASEDLPQLTVRHVTGPDPVAVILDPNGRVAPKGPLFERDDDAAPVLHLVGEGIDLQPVAGVERVPIPVTAAGVAPEVVLGCLAERGLRRVLIEGGGVTVSRFLDAGCLDRLHLLIAPLIIGSGRPGLKLPPVQSLSEARRPGMRSFPLGNELLVDVDLGLDQQDDGAGQAGQQDHDAVSD